MIRCSMQTFESGRPPSASLKGMPSRGTALKYFAALAAAGLLVAASCFSQDVDTQVLHALQWRLIGSFRGGRVSAVAGVPGDPNTFYFGTPGGGIWKTSDAGRVWEPIFDKERVASIGALAVAPSDANIIYAGTGEQTPGKGVYKSTDAGKNWTPAGLADTRFIQAVIVDPRNPDILVAGANSTGVYVFSRPYPKLRRRVAAIPACIYLPDISTTSTRIGTATRYVKATRMSQPGSTISRLTRNS